MFTPHELRLLLCGEQAPSWTREDILNYTEPKHGYNRDRCVSGYFVFVCLYVRLYCLSPVSVSVCVHVSVVLLVCVNVYSIILCVCVHVYGCLFYIIMCNVTVAMYVRTLFASSVILSLPHSVPATNAWSMSCAPCQQMSARRLSSL